MSFEDYELGRRPQDQSYEPFVSKVTATKLSELDLDHELLQQYKAASDTYEAIKAGNTPANQKAQLLNTITTILTGILKLQTDLYNAERLKKLESTLIATLKDFPELREPFLEKYKKALSDD